MGSCRWRIIVCSNAPVKRGVHFLSVWRSGSSSKMYLVETPSGPEDHMGRSNACTHRGLGKAHVIPSYYSID